MQDESKKVVTENASNTSVDTSNPLVVEEIYEEVAEASRRKNAFSKFLRNQKGYIYLLPALAVLIVFTFYPLVNTLILAFREGYDRLVVANPNANVTFSLGFGNFAKILAGSNQDLTWAEWCHDIGAIFAGNTNKVQFITYQTQLFWTAIRNTLVIVFLTVIPSVVIALLIAVALNSIKPLQKVFQTIFFLPYLTNTLAIAAVFQIMFQSTNQGAISAVQGIVNNVIEFFGGTQVDWLNGSNYWASVAVVVIYSIWNGLAFKILILMGALQSVNKQCYEAAKIDSTPKFRVLTKITVPLISPMIAYLLVTGFIGAFKEYTAVLGLFSSPGGTSMGNNNFMITIVGYIYQYIDGNFAGQYGMASAASLILLVIIMIFTAINMYVSKKRVHY